MSTAEERYSVDDYLALEEKSLERHEYFDGDIFLLAGSSFPHNQITGNCLRELGTSLRQSNCNVLPSDMKVRCPSGLRTYPDISIVCGEPQFETENKLTLINPVLIVEVLSESTEAYDRGFKFENYQSIESLREYVLVAQDRAHVDHFELKGDGVWLLTSYGGMEASVKLPALDCSVAMSEVYANVEFPAPPKPPAAAGG